MHKFVEYPKCSTCKKAKDFLDANKVAYEDRHIVDAKPTKDELKSWHKKSGLAVKKLFNTCGKLYREQKLSEKVPTLSDDEAYELLATDGMLVKRPVLVTDDTAVFGFNEASWKQALKID